MQIYTITYGQHPVGIARAADPDSAIGFICCLCSGGSELERFRAREPNSDELEEFFARIGRVAQDGTVGFLF